MSASDHLHPRQIKPLPGSGKHPQGRLFVPTGQYAGDPMKLSPANWLGQSDTPAHGDPIAWHSSEQSSLPRTDDYENRQYDPSEHEGVDVHEYDTHGNPNPDFVDYSVDSKDRPMTAYGSAVGMHFGNLDAASSFQRPYIHPARIPQATMAEPPRGTFGTTRPGGSIAGGPYKSHDYVITVGSEGTGERTPDWRWSDTAANFSEKSTNLVEQGKTLAYRNEVEAPGSTSYRALPETTRTWSEDVMSAKGPNTGRASSKYGWNNDEHSFRNTPHPALVHLAEKGYDPVILPHKTPPTVGMRDAVYQQQLDWSTQKKGPVTEQPWNMVKAQTDHAEAFKRGRTWTMAKPEGGYH